MIAEIVPAALDRERLDRVVALMADVSRTTATTIITAGAVRIDGEVETTGRRKVALGQRIEIDRGLVPVAGAPQPDPAVAFTVVHDDDAVIVVDKPAGLVVHPGAGNPDGTLVNGLLARYPELATVGDSDRPGIVHRLDAGSSGLLVVARTEQARQSLIEQLSTHRVARRYVAVVWGHPAAASGIIDAPIGRNPRDPLKRAIVAGGRESRTHYQVTATHRDPALASLSCQLETGRTHQIRVHLASIGHPLVGDVVYGKGRPTMGLTRPFLHAAELGFVHPVSGEQVEFLSELPADLAQFLAALEQA